MAQNGTVFCHGPALNAHRLRVSVEGSEQMLEPVRRRQAIVVGKRDDVARASLNPGLASISQCPRSLYVSGPGSESRLVGAFVGPIVDHDDLGGGMGLLLQGGKRPGQ